MVRALLAGAEDAGLSSISCCCSSVRTDCTACQQSTQRQCCDATISTMVCYVEALRWGRTSRWVALHSPLPATEQQQPYHHDGGHNSSSSMCGQSSSSHPASSGSSRRCYCCWWCCCGACILQLAKVWHSIKAGRVSNVRTQSTRCCHNSSSNNIRHLSSTTYQCCHHLVTPHHSSMLCTRMLGCSLHQLLLS